jgi:hypothetical protein
MYSNTVYISLVLIFGAQFTRLHAMLIMKGVCLIQMLI